MVTGWERILNVLRLLLSSNCHKGKKVSVFKKIFDTPEVTKLVLPKVPQNFKETPNCTCWPKKLNQKGFPRNIQYRTRPKRPPFQFFSALRDFFRKKISQSSPFNFFGVLRQNGCGKIPKIPLSIFFGIVRLFPKNLSGAVEENTLTLWSPFAIFEP